MADYKRFVTYLYQYENDVKNDNIGYARIESRGNQCKFLIHITNKSMEYQLLKAYTFYRNSGRYRFAYLGNALVTNGVAELKVKADRNNVMNSDLALEDMCGIIVYKDRDHFIGGEWDELPLTQVIIDQIESVDLSGDKSSTTYSEVTGPKETLVREPMEQIGDTLSKERMQQDIANEVMPVKEEFVEEQTTQVPNQETPVSIMREQTIPEYDAMRVKTKGQEDRITQQYRNIDYQAEDSNQEENEIETMETASVLYEDEEELREEENYIKEVASTLAPENVCGDQIKEQSLLDEMERRQQKFVVHPVAQNIFERFPGLHPFEDHEISSCVKIEPQDIGLLPIDAWILGNNSFLLHGYYTYRHLIFGKITLLTGYVYILGVPGVYNNRERFMARMFGFNNFKSARMKQLQQGDYGYWYLPIILN